MFGFKKRFAEKVADRTAMHFYIKYTRPTSGINPTINLYKDEFIKRYIWIDSEYNAAHHSAVVVDALNAIQEEFIGKSITAHDDTYGLSLRIAKKDGCPDTGSGRTCIITQEFDAALNKLYAPDICNAEHAYYKTYRDYDKFKNSLFFMTLEQKFQTYLSGHHPSITYEETASISIDNSFEFDIKLYNGFSSHDDGRTYYEHAHLLGGGCHFRKLSIEELSMLAVAMKEAFPEYISTHWEHFIYTSNGEGSEGYYLKSYISPSFITQPPKAREISTGPRDLYS